MTTNKAVAPQKPVGLLYTKTHEWVRRNGDNLTIGITDIAQHQVGEIIVVQLPNARRLLNIGEPFGQIEFEYAVSDLYSPVTGEIVAVNDLLHDAPFLVNSDPYGDGWLLSIRPRNEGELTSLLDAPAYQAYIEDIGLAFGDHIDTSHVVETRGKWFKQFIDILFTDIDLTTVGCWTVFFLFIAGLPLLSYIDDALHPSQPDKVDYVQGARSLNARDATALLENPKIAFDNEDCDEDGNCSQGDERTITLTITNHERSALTDVVGEVRYSYHDIGTVVTTQYDFQAKNPIRPGASGTLEATDKDRFTDVGRASPPTLTILGAHIE